MIRRCAPWSPPTSLTEAFRVAAAAGGQEMERVLASEPVDLIVLDLKLAGEDGLALIRGIRARSAVPIIAVTGHRLDEVDRVVGLELGADDYLSKPFGLRELLARIGAVLRRAEAATAATPAEGGGRGPGARRTGALSLRRLGTGLADPPASIPGREPHTPDQERVQSARGISARPTARAEPRATARGNAAAR